MQLFLKLPHRNRGEWSFPKPVLSYGYAPQTFNVSGATGAQMKAAFEDFSVAVTGNALAESFRDVIDAPERNVGLEIDGNSTQSQSASFNGY